MQIRPGIVVSDEDLGAICARHGVRELAIFGSSARGDFTEDSDVDLLVEFLPDARIGFIEFFVLREELEALVRAPVDLVSRRGLKPVMREPVLTDARTLYAA